MIAEADEPSPTLLAARLAAGEAPDTATVRWLCRGFQNFYRGCGPLDVCLQLTAGNRISARNAALALAAQIIDAGRGLSAWHLAELVRQAADRFESLTLPRLRRGVAGTLTPLDSALRDAFAAGAAPLRSRQRIYDVISTFKQLEK